VGQGPHAGRDGGRGPAAVTSIVSHPDRCCGCGRLVAWGHAVIFPGVFGPVIGGVCPLCYKRLTEGTHTLGPNGIQEVHPAPVKTRTPEAPAGPGLPEGDH
jgi:hypothetical protein